MADRIEANYETLETVAKSFDTLHDRMESVVQDLERRVESLLSEGWEGKGSDAFGAEMRGEVFPRLKRMVAALDAATRATREISQVISNAEDDACSKFRG